MEAVDWLVLTAANAAQARGYEAQLRARERAGRLAGLARRWMVVTDPRGRRAGSGGSTLVVLYELARRLAREQASAGRKKEAPISSEGGADRRPGAAGGAGLIADLFADQRVLVIHSGGDSRRLPAYAAQGKIFAPVPWAKSAGRGGEQGAADLFDLVAEDLAAIVPARGEGAKSPVGGRVVIGAGDVYLGIARHRPEINGPGVLGVAYPDTPQRGSRHGVYVHDKENRVVDFLQKPTAAEAAARGAIDADGRVLIDTGIVSLDPASVERWLVTAGARISNGRFEAGAGVLAGLIAGRGPAIDLYQHIMMALGAKLNREDYLDAVRGPDAREREAGASLAYEALYDGLRGGEFHVAAVPGSEFVHIGTSREFLEVMSEGARARIVVKGSTPGEPPRLAGENIVVGVPVEFSRRVELPRGWGLVCLPIGTREWAAVVYGVDDDAKTDVDAGGTLGGQELKVFADRVGERIFAAVNGGIHERTLWTARLWRIGRIDAVMQDAAAMVKVVERLGRGSGVRSAGRGLVLPAAWRRGPRFSLAELIPRVNHARLIAQCEEARRRARVSGIAERLAADRWASSEAILDDVRTAEEAREVIRSIERAALRTPDELEQARLLRACAMVGERFGEGAGRVRRAGRPPRPRGRGHGHGRGHRDGHGHGRDRARDRDWDREAFAAVARAVAGELEIPKRGRPAAILADQIVWVTTPVRIDFAGGWSDTPPVCQELGGSVVNGAITLNGQYPVQVMARLSDQPALRINSVDLGRSVTLTDSAAVCDYSDPRDWAALAKAALVLTGIAPASPRESLARRLRQLRGKGGRSAGGLDVTIFSALPKGSGLGTSSVLGAAILAALDRLLGDPIDAASIIRRTSLLEQMMSTAGGWQDQAGGITPGVKLLRTGPGRDQTPEIERLGLDDRAGGPLVGRLLLYYTGYQRLARDILRNVVARYLARDPAAIQIVQRLKAGADAMRADLARGDAEGFARGVAEYWELKKAIDPGATNARIERILGRIQQHLSAYELPGAGGGGFIFMIARDRRAAEQVRAELKARPPNQLARFYDFEIDQKGLSVSVL